MIFRGRVINSHANLVLEALGEQAKDKGFCFESNPYDFAHYSEWDAVDCGIKVEGEDGFRAAFHLQQMPGCCAVLVLSYVHVLPHSQENFDRVLKLIEDGTKEAGFGSLVMTQVVPAYSKMLWREEPWIKCLDRGWKYSLVFRNLKSGNLVTYLTKDMEQPIEKESTQEGS